MLYRGRVGGGFMTPSYSFLVIPLYAAITKANGVYAHHKRGNVNWKISIFSRFLFQIA